MYVEHTKLKIQSVSSFGDETHYWLIAMVCNLLPIGLKRNESFPNDMHMTAFVATDARQFINSSYVIYLNRSRSWNTVSPECVTQAKA